MKVDVWHRNQYNDYCGEPEHSTLEEAIACAEMPISMHTEYRVQYGEPGHNVPLEDHVVILSLKELADMSEGAFQI